MEDGASWDEKDATIPNGSDEDGKEFKGPLVSQFEVARAAELDDD